MFFFYFERLDRGDFVVGRTPLLMLDDLQPTIISPHDHVESHHTNNWIN